MTQGAEEVTCNDCIYDVNMERVCLCPVHASAPALLEALEACLTTAGAACHHTARGQRISALERRLQAINETVQGAIAAAIKLARQA